MPRLASLAVLTLLAAHAASAQESSVDAEFLEFLGSLDSEDGSWTEFLAAIDLKQVTAKSAQPEPKKAERPPSVESEHDGS